MRIVCGVDDSHGARRAAAVAGDLTGRLGARLTVVAVFSPVLFAVPEGRTPRDAEGQDRASLLAERRRRTEAMAAQVADDAGVAAIAELRVMSGDPARVLVAEAQRAGDEVLIVVGSRGQGAIRAAILGSVSSQLVRDAPCPVVVVPSDVAAAPAD